MKILGYRIVTTQRIHKEHPYAVVTAIGQIYDVDNLVEAEQDLTLLSLTVSDRLTYTIKPILSQLELSLTHEHRYVTREFSYESEA